ncbi:hypothetical protein HYQ46_009972 [Verticillium longisporum]|nr:hypothetical protein HYQ46_009972 [Verticillium longisporum]
MSATTAKRLVVCGGNGFLGSRICKYAVQRGWDVTSVSRSGEPRWDTVTSSASPPSWSHKVTWERADILQPSTYAPLLKGADYVVHSMGILLEADYKGAISGRESPLAGLQKAFAPVKDRGIVNPLKQEPGKENIRPTNLADQFSYEVMNRDSAVMLAKQAAAEDASAFFPRMRGVFVRPPFLYDSSRKLTLPMAAMTGTGALFNTVTGGPLPVETVAEAVVEALDDDKVRGPIEIPQIEELANKSWRKNML